MKKISCIFLFVTFAIVLFADPACLDSIQVVSCGRYTFLWYFVVRLRWRYGLAGSRLVCVAK